MFGSQFARLSYKWFSCLLVGVLIFHPIHRDPGLTTKLMVQLQTTMLNFTNHPHALT